MRAVRNQMMQCESRRVNRAPIRRPLPQSLRDASAQCALAGAARSVQWASMWCVDGWVKMAGNADVDLADGRMGREGVGPPTRRQGDLNDDKGPTGGGVCGHELPCPSRQTAVGADRRYWMGILNGAWNEQWLNECRGSGCKGCAVKHAGSNRSNVRRSSMRGSRETRRS